MKIYSTRMSDKRQVDEKCYILTIGKKSFYFNARWKTPTEYFDKGWKKIKEEHKMILIDVPKMESYQDIYDNAVKYGAEICAQMLGFSISSYGDHYPLREIKQLVLFGQRMVEWLEKIAEIDGCMYKWMTDKLGCEVRNTVYDTWICKGDECSFRNNPFLGYHVETILQGYFAKPASIDIISWDDAFWKFVLDFHPDYEKWDNGDDNYIVELRKKYDSISCKGWVEIFAGKENAEWLSKNLSPFTI